MSVKLRTVSGTEIYLNPNQVVLVMPHPQIIGQCIAVGGGVTEFFAMSRDELAERLWPSSEPKLTLVR